MNDLLQSLPLTNRVKGKWCLSVVSRVGGAEVLVDDRPSEEELAKDLKGKTLRVYWYMLRHPEPMTAREIQRGADLSSPSLSMHHLEKLKNMGLVDKDVHGQYTVARDVRVGVLKMFVGRGRLLVPRFLFYATFYTSVAASITVMLVAFFSWSALVLLLLVYSICIIMWYESLRIWRQQPFPENDE